MLANTSAIASGTSVADRKKTTILQPKKWDVGAGLGINFVEKPITFVQNPPSPQNKFTDNPTMCDRIQQYPYNNDARSPLASTKPITSYDTSQCMEFFGAMRAGKGGFCIKFVGRMTKFIPKPAPTALR